jgi:hypothetical protein
LDNFGWRGLERSKTHAAPHLVVQPHTFSLMHCFLAPQCPELEKIKVVFVV